MNVILVTLGKQFDRGGFAGFSEGTVDVQQVSSGAVAVAFLQLATLDSPLHCHCSTVICPVPEGGSCAGSSWGKIQFIAYRDRPGHCCDI